MEHGQLVGRPLIVTGTVTRDTAERVDELRALRFPGTRLMFLEDADLVELARELEIKVVPAGEIVVRFAGEAERAYLILEGRFEVANGRTLSEDGPVNEAGAGDFLGEVALLAGGTYSREARALTHARLGVLDRDGLKRVVERSPGTWKRLAAMAQNKMLWARLGAELDRIFGPFEDQRNSALEGLESQITWRSLRSGEVLFEQGDEGDDAYILLSGRLRVAVLGPDGGRRIISELGSGEMVGEIALLADRPRTATVFAARDCELARLSRQGFETMVRRNTDAMVQVSRILVDRMVAQQSGSQRPATYSSIALVPLGPTIDMETFGRELVACLEVLGRTAFLSRHTVGASLGVKDVADIDDSEPAHLRLVRLLHDQEENSEVLLFEADATWSPWTRRCIRQADHLVLVADADTSSELSEIEENLVNPSQRTSLVLVHPNDCDRPRLTSRWLEHRQPDAVYHVRTSDQGHMNRLARTLTGNAIGLVLGGGGGKGFAHLGLLRAIEELGVPIDMIGGTSMGAPIAHLPAQGHSAAEAHEIIKKGFHKLLDYTLPLVSVLAGKRINRTIERFAIDWLIEDLWLPYFCLSTNITSAQPVVHRRGNLARAVRASVAIPGVLPPVPFRGDLLVDGGVLNNLPIDAMRQLNPSGPVIAVDVVPRQGPVAESDFGYSVSGWGELRRRLTPWRKKSALPTLTATVLRSIVVGADRTRRKMLDDDLADLYINIDVSGVRMMQFDAVDEVAAIGYHKSVGLLEDWLEAGGLDKALGKAASSPSPTVTSSEPAPRKRE